MPITRSPVRSSPRPDPTQGSPGGTSQDSVIHPGAGLLSHEQLATQVSSQEDTQQDSSSPSPHLYLSETEDSMASPEAIPNNDFPHQVTSQVMKIKALLKEGKSLTKANKENIVKICDSLILSADEFSRNKPERITTEPHGAIPHKQETLNDLKKNMETELKDIKKLINRSVSMLHTLSSSLPPQAENESPSSSAVDQHKKIVVSRDKNTARSFRPAIVISPKGEASSHSDTLKAWRKSVCFTDTNFSPASIKYTSNYKIVAEFDKTEHIDAVLKKANTTSSEVTARSASSLKPMFILKGISKNISTESLPDIICGQNDCIKKNLLGWDDISLKFIQRNRNENLYNAIFMTTPSVWQAVIDSGHLNINHQRVHASNHIPLLQCFKCLQFGHTKNRCTNSFSVCSHCSSPQHGYKDCPVKADSSKANCHNCSEFNNRHNITNKSSAHSATSMHCPRLISMKNRTQQRVNYGV